MIVLLVILAVIALILLIPVAVQVSYLSGVMLVRARIGFIRFTIMPRKEKELTPEQRAKKERKKIIKAAKKETKKAAKAQKKGLTEKPPKKLEREDIIALIKLGLKALSRFRRRLDVDVLHIKILVKNEDPFDCVTRYGYINAAIGSILPLLHMAFKIRDEDIQTDFSMEEGSTQYQGKIVVSIQIWESLIIVISALIGVLKWYRQFKKNQVQAEENPVTT